MKIMKRNNYMLRTIVAMFTIVLFGLGFVASDEDEMSELSGITISGIKNHALSIEIGETYQVKASASGKTLQWESKNESVVTVDQNGLLTAVGLGEARITIYPVEGEINNGNYIDVTVTDKGISFVDDAIDQSEAE